MSHKTRGKTSVEGLRKRAEAILAAEADDISPSLVVDAQRLRHRPDHGQLPDVWFSGQDRKTIRSGDLAADAANCFIPNKGIIETFIERR